MPHERTMPGPIKDRMRVLRTVRANLSPVYALWRGPTPELAARWSLEDGPDWASMPMLVFNEKDELQDEALARLGVSTRPPVVHRVPSAGDFFEAVRLGLGWGMLPDLQASPDLAAGRLVRLPGDIASVPLHWQHWRLESPRLARLTRSVRHAASRHLHR
jgi:LysR family transcriptional regulator (chromosome initiation inhibitor)